MTSFKANLSIGFVLCIAFSIQAANVEQNAFKIQPRIAGGSTADENQFKYMVGIHEKAANFDGIIAGGALLTERYIISTARILTTPGAKLTAIIGTPKYEAGKKPWSNALKIEIDRVSVNPDFAYNDLVGNLGMLRTKEPVIFSDHIQPIALPSSGFIISSGLKAIVTGWGLLYPNQSPASNNKLQFLETKTLQHADCMEELESKKGSINDWEKMKFKLQRSTAFCTSNSKGEGIVGRDIGAPLVSNGKLIGINLLAFKTGLPNLYADVNANSVWIQRELRRE